MLYIPEPNTGCWLWIGFYGGGKRNYPAISINSRPVPATRFAYQHFVGQIPSGLLVCHHCDTPQCVNPRHMFLGTNQENMSDRNRKFRQAWGERGGRAKLTAEQVREIRSIYKKGCSKYPGNAHELARRFKISPTTIYSIISGKSWFHLDENPQCKQN